MFWSKQPLFEDHLPARLVDTFKSRKRWHKTRDAEGNYCLGDSFTVFTRWRRLRTERPKRTLTRKREWKSNDHNQILKGFMNFNKGLLFPSTCLLIPLLTLRLIGKRIMHFKINMSSHYLHMKGRTCASKKEIGKTKLYSNFIVREIWRYPKW